MSWLEDVAALVKGTLAGRTKPAQPARPLPDFDARTHALRRFADFLSLCEFSRTGDEGAPALRYRVPRADIFIEQPSDEARLRFPSLAFVSGRGKHDAWSLGPAELVEESRDVYAPGSALLDMGEYIEPLMVEAWTSQPSERRSLLAGVETVLRMSERSNALRLTLPAYYDRTATFTLVESQYTDDPDVIRGRRRGMVVVELRVPEVLLVNVVTLRPYVDIEVATAADPRTDV